MTNKKNSTTTLSPVNQTTTCQICGRTIKSNTGTIAHHGYKRPGGGWQTASCLGAKYLPYEQSADRIPYAIDLVAGYVERQKYALDQLMSNPPETLTRTHHKREVTATRPDGFDPAKTYRSYSFVAYDTFFFEQKYRIEQDIAAAQHDLEYLRTRLADWKAPEQDGRPEYAVSR